MRSRVSGRSVSGRREGRLWRKLRGREGARQELSRAGRDAARGDAQQTLLSCEKALRLRPDDARLRLRVAELLARSGETRRALRAYQEASERFAREGRERQAASVLTQAIRLAPHDAALHTRLGDLYCDLEFSAEALAAYTSALGLSREAANPESSAALLKRILRLDPSDTQVWRELTREQRLLESADSAARELEALLEELASGREAASRLAVVDAVLDELEDADGVLTLSLRDAAARGHLAEGDAALAVRRLLPAAEAIADEDPRTPDLLELLVQAHEAAGSSEAATHTRRRLLEIFRLREDDDRARALAQRLEHDASEQVEPETPEPSPPEGGDTSGSFAGNPFADPGDLDMCRDLAVGYLQMQAYGRGLAALEPILAHPTRREEVLALAAACRRGLGEHDAAVEMLEEAIGAAERAEADAMPLRYELGETLVAAGEPERALTAFLEVAVLRPGFREVEARIVSLEGEGVVLVLDQPADGTASW